MLIGQRLAVVNSSESIRRASADDKEFHFSKRNFEQLATIPEVKRNEQDSLVGTTSTKIEKRAKSDIHPKTITFLDSKRNRQLRFPIFAERDLKFINQDMQTTIHDAVLISHKTFEKLIINFRMLMTMLRPKKNNSTLLSQKFLKTCLKALTNKITTKKYTSLVTSPIQGIPGRRL